MLSKCLVLVHVQFPAASQIGEEVFSKIAPKTGLLCGKRSSDGAVFIRGTGIIIQQSEAAASAPTEEVVVITSGSLFPFSLSLEPSLSIFILSFYNERGDNPSSLLSPSVSTVKVLKRIALGNRSSSLLSGSLIILSSNINTKISFPISPSSLINQTKQSQLQQQQQGEQRSLLSSPIIVCGSAFGVSVFSPSFFNGFIISSSSSSSATKTPGLFLIDAHAPPGMEGSLVFCSKTFTPLGILLRSLVSNNHILPISVVASFSSLSISPFQTIETSSSPLITTNQQQQFFCDKILPSIVLLTFEQHWATGIVISTEGDELILTTSHFLNHQTNGNNNPICVHYYHKNSSSENHCYETADVVFCSKADNPLDIALLQVRRRNDHGLMKNAATISLDYSEGDTVFVIGHHLISPADSSCFKTGPLCLQGTLSSVVKIGHNTKAMLLVSAPSYEGASGGAIVDVKGNVIGLSVGNLEGAEGIPAVCLAIPSEIIKGVLKEMSVEAFYLNTFKTTQSKNQLSSLWNLAFDFDIPSPKL